MTEAQGSRLDVRDEARKVASLIDTARRLLAEGRMVELSALEGKVQTLCDAIRRAPPEDAEELKSPIRAILEGLDRLEAELTVQNEVVTARQEDAVRRQAMEAYRSEKDES